tara:strand:+ start:4775 stop:5155 length:381 start_codon:yes stop_codon:yes gene_type:complete
MLNKLGHILKYYDSEPTEIMQGLIWFLLFPIIYILEVGLNLWILIPSILIGYGTLRAVCFFSLRKRKTFAYACFILSLVVCALFLCDGRLLKDATHLGWIFVAFSALTSLKRVTARYYAKKTSIKK